jgi:L-rhamnose isomerase
MQDAGNFSKLIVTQEELKTLPFGAIWEEYLTRQKVPASDWYSFVEKYEDEVLKKRTL